MYDQAMIKKESIMIKKKILKPEATSNLDYKTEEEIQKSIDKLKGKTLIVSAHRLSTLKNMDKIIFLSKGKIIEQGTYEELMKKKKKFYNLQKQKIRKKYRL